MRYVLLLLLLLSSGCGKLPDLTKGDKGDPGESGLNGKDGQTGSQGPQGPQGAQGPAGTDASPQLNVVIPCKVNNGPNANGYQEALLKIGSSYFRIVSGPGTYLSALQPGTLYTTQDSRGCQFMIGNVGEIYTQN